MDCTHAQEAITAALDKQPIDAEYLTAAKEHCRTCPDCGAFVRAQLVVKQMPLPEPPADLADRVMASIRAEASAEEAAARAAVEAQAVAAQAAEALPKPEPEPIATLRSPVRRRKPLGRTATAIALASVAAVMFVAAVSLAVFGSSQMNANRGVRTSVYDGGTGAVATAPQATTEMAPSAAPEAAGKSASTDASGGASAASAAYITINGSVFELSKGSGSVDQSKLTIVGVTTTALASGNPPIQRNVLSGTDPAILYIADDANQVLTFIGVTRTFQGTTYQMMSAPVAAFGIWPALPAQIPSPNAADGSPAFASAGKDNGGTTVYKLKPPNTGVGIAVGPNTAASDPARSNPGWTWWAPLR